MHEGCHANIGGCGLTPESRANGHDEATTAHITLTGGALIAVGVAPNHVVEDAATVRIHIFDVEITPALHLIVQLLVRHFIAAT